MSDIFLSYARQDRERAAKLAEALEAVGWSVFWDLKIPPGLTWDEYIGDKLDAARCVVVAWSATAVGSQWVREEAREGRERGVLVPVMWEVVRPPFGFRGVQAVDLSKWEGAAEAREFRRLVAGVERIIGPAEAEEADQADEVAEGRRSAHWKARAETVSTAGVAGAEWNAPRPGKGAVGRVVLSERGSVELVPIPAGRFMMGSPDGEVGRQDNEGPVHEVSVAQFEIGRYAVTNEEYGRFLEANRGMAEPQYRSESEFNEARQPVVGVTWEDARRFATWAGCRLPTEAEWEYAARAGTTEPYLTGTGERDLDRFAWHTENSDDRLHPVGEKEQNAWGLYDVLGNALEWVEDDWHDSYEGAPADGSAWVDEPRGEARVLRGGSFFHRERVAYREPYRPAGHGVAWDIGFRVARSRGGGED